MKPKYSSLCPKTSQDTTSCVCPQHQNETNSDLEPVLDDNVDTPMILPQNNRGSNSGTEEAGSLRRMNHMLGTIILTLLCFSGCLILVACGELLSYKHPDCSREDGQQNGACNRVSDAAHAYRDQPSGLKCNNECTFTLVESIPQNLTYRPNETVHTSTYAGLKTLLASAQKSIRIASFYWTLRGDDVPFYDDSAKEGEDIFNSLLLLSREGSVSLQIAQNAVSNDTDLLAKEGSAEVRTLNFTHLMGDGVLHTKFWLVDDQHFYLGSANLDWRSLTQVKELGIVVQNCSCLATDLEKIFQVYWYLGKPDASVPPTWPPSYSTTINATSPATVNFNNTQATVYMSSSPPPFCPMGRTGDIDAILRVIGDAQHFIYIAVMDYIPTTLYHNPKVYWPKIDDALRHAAFDRHVTVKLLASHWKHTLRDMFVFLCSLQMLKHTQYPRVKMEVKLFEVPIFTKNQSEIPYSRVNHNKYMVTDQDAYIGTSNWSGDYFINTAGVGFVMRQPHGSMNTTQQGNLRQQLFDIFSRDWNSVYASDLFCNFTRNTPFEPADRI